MHISIPIAHHLIILAVVLCRIGGAIVLFPAIGERFLPLKVKLFFALILSIVITISFPHIMPVLPTTTLDLILLLSRELLIGVSLGMVLRILLNTMHTVGVTITAQAGLSSGMMFGPSQGQDTTVLSTFFKMFGVLLLLTLDLHLVLLTDILESYETFKVGSFFDHSNDFAMLMVKTASTAFNTGVKLALPFIVVGILTWVTAGLVARFVPYLAVFLVMLPGHLIIMLWLLLLCMTHLSLKFADYYAEAYNALWGG